ncbi:tetratricopeptide repeat protein [Pseudomonas costantinii]|uniref:tetratricopeptide repeat protein n=1 Tax=Pseudomonas costantinii TaxID=168469 RepID=UPI0015A12D69|nr:sel1 repeat family protein [Pseudomonas costantinii]NVZ69126.1 sel1 repeat family protein [Pseudomonas costantinii]
MKLPTRPSLLLLALWLGDPVFAGQSLEQVRYALYKDPNANVVADLRELSARGDRASKQLLGDVLSNSDTVNLDEVLGLYKDAFADGAGEIPALASLVRLLDRNPRLRDQQHGYVTRALTLYPHALDPRTISTTLEVFLVYPRDFNVADARQLLSLYQQSCLLNCHSELYQAVLAEREGNRGLADRHYQAAVKVDVRAVDRYYRFLGEQQDSLFQRFAATLEPQRASLPVEIVHRIGALLDSINSLQRIDDEADKDERLASGMGPKPVKAPPTPEQIAADKAKAAAIARVQGWFDNAAERGYVPALVSKVNFMVSNPTEHNAEETQALINRVQALDPTRAKALQASFYMVTNWLTLDPQKAQVLINELIAARYRDAQLLLGELYSKGGLDQPDQEKALQIYQEQARLGSTAAYYRIATLYFRARALCNDPVKAYAYAQVALDLGENRARGLLKRLDRVMKKDDIDRAQLARADLMKEAQL